MPSFRPPWNGEDAHLWEFAVGHERIGSSRAAKLTLHSLLRPRTTKLTYIYDFGDGWQHQLTLTKPRAADPTLAYPRYITGEHAAPPEDCGGIPGFDAQLEISAIPIIPITKTLRIGLATMIPAASTNRPSRTGSPASPTVAEQRPPEPSNVNQLTLTPLLIARIQLPTASLGYRLAAPTRMVPQPKKDMKGEHPGRDSSFRRTMFEV